MSKQYTYTENQYPARPRSQRRRENGASAYVGSTTLLARLAHMGGVDENGNDISNAIVTGVCTVVGVYRDDYQILRATFPELTINYTYMWIKFTDPVAQSICASLWDTNSDGEITEEEAGIERAIEESTFSGNLQLTSFEEFKYFAVRSNSHSLFMGCTAGIR